jgi:hydroxyacylglutathione hydrolase
MYLQQFFEDGLGHGSYLLGDESAGAGAVIDPRRDFDVYLAGAQAAGLTIQHVLETHTHNDYVSGAKELAALTGAQLWASEANGGAGLQYEHRPLREGDEVQVGEVRLRALETPGHTPEHLAYLAYEGKGDHGAGEVSAPLAAFTGGSLMVGIAGRPDLSGAERTGELARAQYSSVGKLLALADGVQVFPTHGGGSFCGGSGGGSRWSTIGIERRTNPLARFVEQGDPAGFAEALLDKLPVIPAYWPLMRPLNMKGPKSLAALGAAPGWPGLLPARALAPQELRDLLASEQVYIVDARDPTAFAGAHIAGSFSIGLGASFGIWVGSVVPNDRPLALVLPGGEGGSPLTVAGAWEEAVRQLLRAGYEQVAGYLAGGLRAWAVEALPIESIRIASAQSAACWLKEGEASLLDVRQPKEWADGHAPGSTHIPGALLPAQLESLDRSRPWLTACSTGYRSSIAASLLRRAGFTEVTNVLGGMSGWGAAGLPLTR